MTLEQNDKIKQTCLKALNEFGMPSNIRSLCLEAVQFEYDVSVAILRLHDKLRQLKPTRDNITSCLDNLRQTIENMINNFKEWNQTLDALISKAISLPPLKANQLQSKEIKAPCGMQTQELTIEEGETLRIIDTSQANYIQVRNVLGKEGLIPILSFVLPSSDKSVNTLMQRLQIHLLSSWTECSRHFSVQLLRSTNVCLESLSLKCKKLIPEAGVSNSAAELKIVQQIVTQLEKDYLNRPDKVATAKAENASSLSKAFHCYQDFDQMCQNFRVFLEGKKPRPICIFDNLADFKQQVTQGKQLRYYKTKYVVESTEIREEITHVPSILEPDTISQTSLTGGSSTQKVQAEHLTSSSKEVKQKFKIRSVKDARNGKNVSLDEALKLGIMDPSNGVYVNLETGETKPIIQAMNEGLIHVENVTETQTEQKTEALGLITIRDVLEDRRQYTIIDAIDALTAEKLDPEEATKRGLLENGTFLINTSGQKIPLEEAIDVGWVQVEYDPNSNDDVTYESKTYAVRSVVDQRLKRTVSFLEAVRKGLIDKDTGNYVNNSTGEKVYVVDAIKRGFLKATVIDDPSSLQIDPSNRVVIERIGKVKTLVSTIGALTHMKNSAKNKAL